MRTASFACLTVLVILSTPLRGFANPSGGHILAGSGSISGGAGSLTIKQFSTRGIITWQDFSIGAGESTKFIQPNGNAVLLNRVIGGGVSNLLGSLTANGKIYLINPNGILVGGGAVINTNGFLASSLDVANSQFMAGGDLKFAGASTAAVTNLGKISAGGGDIFLIGNTVRNGGSLKAPNGTVGLAAGQEVLLKSSADEALFVAPGAKSGGVTNAGTIAGAQAELKASGNLYALAINNTGIIRATGVVHKNGRVILSSDDGTVSNSGKIMAQNADGSGGSVTLNSGAKGKTVHSGIIDASGKAKGKKGGQVQVLGGSVHLIAGSLIDVSGDAGGGTAWIGGGLHGTDPLVPDSLHTTVDAGARITADALTLGNGGQITIWSDDDTHFAGAITARGGASEGDGGFAEVSSKGLWGFSGTADLSAAAGKIGSLLLDPPTITLMEGSGMDATDGSIIYQSNLEAITANTILDAATSITAAANNPSQPFTVTLNNADVSLEMDLDGPGTIDLTQARFVTMGASGITINKTNVSGVTVLLNDLSAGSDGIVVNGNTIQPFQHLTTSDGQVTLTGGITLEKDLAIVTNGGAVTFAGKVTSGGLGPFSLIVNTKGASASGDITFTAGASILNALTLTGNNITTNSSLTSFGNGNTNDIETTGAVSMTAAAGKTITLNADVITDGALNQTYTTDHLTLVPDQGPSFGDYGSSIAFNSGVGGTLTLAPATPGQAMSITGQTKLAGALSLTDGEVQSLDFTNFVFGTKPLGAASPVGAITFTDFFEGGGQAVANNVTIYAATCTVGAGEGLRANGAITFAVANSVTFGDNSEIEAGGAVTFTGPVILPNDGSNLSIAGSQATFSGPIDGGCQLTVTVSSGGSLTFGSPIGATTPLSSLSIIAPAVASVTLPATKVTGAISIEGDSSTPSVLPVAIGESGPVTALSIAASASGNIDLSNAGNQIRELEAITFGSDFQLTDAASFVLLQGVITGGASSQATIEVHGGTLAMNPGVTITISGLKSPGVPNNLLLYSDQGFYNDAGASVLNMQNGARWIIYVPGNTPGELVLGGLVPAATTNSLVFPGIPIPATTLNTLAIAPPSTPAQQIVIVAGAAGSQTDDSDLSGGAILFTSDFASTPVITISVGELESLTGNITLQAAGQILLGTGLDLTLATGAGHTVTFQTSTGSSLISPTAGASISLGSDVTTGGGGITLLAPAGGVITQVLNSAGGNVKIATDTLSFGPITAGAGTVSLNVTNGALVSPGGNAPNISAAALELIATTGIGSAANPITTTVNNLEAETTTGGVFITNSGGNVVIGGVDPAIAGIYAGAGAIVVKNNASISLTDTVEQASVTGFSTITFNASGAASDIVIGDNLPDSIYTPGGVFLTAGRDIVIGANGATGGVEGGGGVNLTAGRNIDALEAGYASVMGLGSGGISLTAVATIFVGSQLDTNGGAITLSTNAGGTVNLETSGAIQTNLTAKKDGAVTFQTDDLILAGAIRAGNNVVKIMPTTLALSINVGTATSGELSLTNAELNLIHAGTVVIGDPSNPTDLEVTAPITVTTFNNLDLNGLGDTVTTYMNGHDLLQAAVTVPGQLDIQVTNGLSSVSNITANSLVVGAESISFPVDIAGTLTLKNLSMNGNDSITLGGANSISQVGNVSFGDFLDIQNNGNLTINGVIGGNSPSSAVVITVNNGNLTLAPGARITASGAGEYTILNVSNGYFINNAGSSALVTQSQSRFVVYSLDNGHQFKTGGLGGTVYTTAAVKFSNDPVLTMSTTPVAPSVFYFANIVAPSTPAIGPGTGPLTITSFIADIKNGSFSQLSNGTINVFLGQLTPSQIKQFAGASFTTAQLHNFRLSNTNKDDLIGIVGAFASSGALDFTTVATLLSDVNEGGNAPSANTASQGNNTEHVLDVDASQVLLEDSVAQERANATAQLGFTPISGMSYALQEAFQESATYGGKGTLSAADMGYVLAAVGNTLNATQVEELTPANIAYLVSQGQYQEGSTDDSTYLDNNWNNNGSVLTAAQTGYIMAAGPVALSSNQGTPILNDNFFPTGIKSTLAANLPAGGADTPVVPTLWLPALGAVALIPPGDGSGPILNSDTGAPLITQDGGGVVSNDGGSVVSNDGGSLVSTALITQDGGGLITQDGGGLITQDGGGLVGDVESALITQDGGGLITQDGGGLLPPIGGGVISPNGGNVISPNGGNFGSGY